MNYYKDKNNQVYAFEADGSQDEFIGDDLVPISNKEADALRAPSLSDIRLSKKIDINTTFEKLMEPIINGIPSIERESWKKQETEARAYQDNPNASTPLIDALSESRGITKSVLVSRIIEKADLFATVSGRLIGKRQALEDALNALPESATPEDIAAITW